MEFFDNINCSLSAKCRTVIPFFITPNFLSVFPTLKTRHNLALTHIHPKIHTSYTVRMSNDQIPSETRAVLIDILQRSRMQLQSDCCSKSPDSILGSGCASCADAHVPEQSLSSASSASSSITNTQFEKRTDKDDKDIPPFLPSPLLSSLYFTVGSSQPNYPNSPYGVYSSYQLVRVGIPILDYLRQMRLHKSRQSSHNYLNVVKRVAQFAFSVVLFLNPFK